MFENLNSKIIASTACESCSDLLLNNNFISYILCRLLQVNVLWHVCCVQREEEEMVETEKTSARRLSVL